MAKLSPSPDRFFDPDPAVRRAARELYESVAMLPLVCPHGHVDARLFADREARLGTPAELFIIPDHYVTRMLYSQGVPLESLLGEADHRKVWRIFCEHFHAFRGTPSGLWLADELASVFGVDEKPAADNADRLYDLIAEKLSRPEFAPRELFERFKVEVLCTTDAATDTLESHAAIRASGWGGRVLPTFRPDGVVNLDLPDWPKDLERLSEASGIDIKDYASYIRALESRRQFFRSMGATATDHGALTAATGELTPSEARAIFARALKGRATAEQAARFTAHMLMEMARMSVEDGLVMQLHPGSLRDHNDPVYRRFGANLGGDIPVAAEFTRNLRPLLNNFGNDPRFTLIVFTLDETTYARELAPLAGFYPALKLGPPWWFFDSPNGMARYFDQVMETAGLYNTAGFNDDTRAFCSIPARHDVWRRASANWLGGMAARHVIDMDEAREMIRAMALDLAKRAYRL